jgi:hypothetical protein
MFQPHEVEEIRKVAQGLTGGKPSSGILERLAQVAAERDWTVAALCLEIDALACSDKLGEGVDQNQARADALKTLMHLLGGEDIRNRIRRANALHKINKLREC